jgi:two-component system cell cycle response regulator
MHEEGLGILAEMTQRMLEEASQHAALRQVTDAALRLFRCDHASVRLCGPDGRLDVGARSGVGCELPPLPFSKGQGLLGWVAQTGQPIRVGDSEREPRFVDRRERGFAVGSVLSVPVRSGDRTLGVLSVSSAARDAFRQEDEVVAQLLAGAAAQALRAAELHKLALTDSQTLAYNRRYLVPRLCEEIERAQRHAAPLSVLLMDLDHFKRVNDEHGHAVGDSVLRAFADTVRACVRAVDVVVRRGGEEFVLIMPATDDLQARVVAERVRARLASAPLYVRRDLRLEQTVSIGVATWDGLEGPESLEERADLAMYEAKRRGRNLVVAAANESALREPSAEFAALETPR